MSAWITVYAAHPVEQLDVGFLTDCLHDPIVADMSEPWGLGHDQTLRLLRRCEVHQLRDANDETYSIIVPDRRPVQITRLVAPDRLDEERTEAIETLHKVSRGTRSRVEARLAGLAEIVMLEIGWSALDREEFAAAWYIALELAQSASGLVRDYDDRWWDPSQRGAALR